MDGGSWQDYLEQERAAMKRLHPRSPLYLRAVDEAITECYRAIATAPSAYHKITVQSSFGPIEIELNKSEGVS